MQGVHWMPFIAPTVLQLGHLIVREMEKNNHPMKQGCISIIYNTQLS